MVNRVQQTLDEMDKWISDSPASTAALDPEVILRWRDSLDLARERLSALSVCSQSVVDAFLMRSNSPVGSSAPRRKANRRIAQEQMRRLATAMAALEKELAVAKSELAAGPGIDQAGEIGG